MGSSGPVGRGFTLAALGLVGALAAGCGGGSSTVARHPNYRGALRRAPPPLAALYRGGDRLLGGGAPAYRRRLRTLHGFPVVVNDWASWCLPCRQETPLFGRAAARFGKRVAFLGVDVADDAAAARTFLGERPVPYPSFFDHDQRIPALQGPARGYPRTAFYDARGTLLALHQGPYTSLGALVDAIHTYVRLK